MYRSFYAHKTDEDITLAGLAQQSALMVLNKYFKKYKPDQIIACFDRPNWRKTYTKSDECVSNKIYKGNRRQTMTPKEEAKYETFIQHMADFEALLQNYSSIVVLAKEKLEADDLIAGFTELYSMSNNVIVIISGDKDFIQLLKYPNVSLIDPATGKPRTLVDWNQDSEFFMYEKCIRGDRGDNIQSAYPRCKKTRITKAYNNSLAHVNLMHEVWTDPVSKEEFIVGKLFEENQKLMDLTKQPEHIQQEIFTTIIAGINNPGSYSHFHFLKFCGEFQLKRISSQAEMFAPLLSR
jgi:hypothetical protein